MNSPVIKHETLERKRGKYAWIWIRRNQFVLTSELARNSIVCLGSVENGRNNTKADRHRNHTSIVHCRKWSNIYICLCPIVGAGKSIQRMFMILEAIDALLSSRNLLNRWRKMVQTISSDESLQLTNEPDEIEFFGDDVADSQWFSWKKSSNPVSALGTIQHVFVMHNAHNMCCARAADTA